MKEYVLYLRTLEQGVSVGVGMHKDDAKPTYLVKPRYEYNLMFNLKGESKDAFTRTILAESDDEAELIRFVDLIHEEG